MPADTEYHIVFSTNYSGHVKYLAAAVRSVVQSCSEPEKLRIHIMWANLSETDLTRLDKSWSDLNTSYTFHPADPLIAGIRHEPQHGFWTYFWLEHVVPETVERVLYLDCDMICCRNVLELWDTDLGDCVIGAVADPLSLHEGLAKNLCRDAERLGIEYSGSDLYINSGTVLIDMQRWRKEKLAFRIVDDFSNGFCRLPLHDQDTLNLCLRKRIKELEPCWNLIEYARLYRDWPFELYPGNPKEYFKAPLRHFSGERKPDRPWVRLGDKKLFYHYLDQTDWRGWRSKWDRSLASVVFSRLLELHYLVTRGIQQKCLDHPHRKTALLILEAPYLIPMYTALPLYRIGLAAVRKLRRAFSKR